MADQSTGSSTSPLRRRMQEDMLMRGLGSHTRQDYVRHVRNFAAFLEAAALARESAEAGNPLGQNLLAVLLFEQDNNSLEAIQLFTSSAEAGFVPAQNSLGLRYELGDGVAKDLVLAAHWYELAAKSGSPEAQVNLAMLYKRGEGVKKDLTRAFQLFVQGAEGGSRLGMVYAGIAYDNGLGVERDLAKAVQWYEEAVAGKAYLAYPRLAELLVWGEGVAPDHERARTLAETAFRLGKRDVGTILGHIHENGLGVTEDEGKAKEYYSAAAKRGDARAKEALERLEAKKQ